MKLIVLALTVAICSYASGRTTGRSDGRGPANQLKWEIESEGTDHITYVRRPVTTTTTPAPTTRRPAPRGNRFNVRSGSRGSTRSGAESSGKYGTEGDYWWMVSHRTDDSITYTRRNSSQGEGQGQQGELRQLGRGSDRVLARVVIPGKDDDLTEEGLLDGTPNTWYKEGGYQGYPTHDLVHPYVKKAPVQVNTRTKSLPSGGRSGGRRQQQQRSNSPPAISGGEEDHPPRVGEELNGWVVVSKSKDHISWERAGSASASSLLTTRSGGGTHLARESRLKSLNDLKSQNNRRPKGKIPSAEGELIEGFPRVFNTYSRSQFPDGNPDSSNVASIRTSLRNSTNWQVGDELAGWKVINKDHRGIIWERIKTPDANIVNEEDLLDELNRRGGESEESDENTSNYPPGTWYLAKETPNSITWQRDNTPEDIVFEMDAYPRVGDVQTGWKVKSKSRDHITWRRIRSNGAEIDSNEDAN